jgi:hypothetical protein
MKKVAGNNLTPNHGSVHGNFETPKINKNYSIHESRTHSQSAQSKLKNLAYTLSRPFRSLMKGHIAKYFGTQNSMDPMKNINAPTTSIRKTGTDPTSPPKISGAINTANGQSTYEIVGGNGGHRSTLAEKFRG